MRDLVIATYGIMMFGTPHRGMAVEKLLRLMVEGGYGERVGLLDECEAETEELESFVDLVGEKMWRVVSFYETQRTMDVEEVRP